MRTTQEEIIIDKISSELSIGNNEKDLAYEIFLKKITSSLQYDETVKIPRIGLFQKKKGLFDGTNPIENTFSNDTIVYAPFQNDKISTSFAFFNIGINNKPINSVDFDDSIFSLSINKPVLKLSISNINQLDSTTSLLLLKKGIEEKINQLIMKSDFFEGINLWNDLIPSNDLVEDEMKLDDSDLNSSDILKEDTTDLVGLDSFIPISDEPLIQDTELLNTDSNNDISLSIEDISPKDDLEGTDLINQLFNQNFKTDVNKNDDSENSVDIDLEFDINEQFNDSSSKLDDEIDLNMSNDDVIEENNDFNEQEEIKSDTFEMDSIVENNSSTTSNDLDWNKELEDELFSKNMLNDEEINLDFNNNDSKQDVNLEDNIDEDNDFDLDFINEQTEDNNSIDIDSIDDTISDLSENDSNNIINEEISNEQINPEEDNKPILNDNNLESNIDDLFESIEQKDVLKQEPPKEKKPFFLSNKLLIILLSIFVVLAAAGGVYYLFFNNKTDNIKHEEKTFLQENVKKEISNDKKETIKIDSNKVDSVNTEIKEKNALKTKDENTLEKKEEIPNVETSKIEKSINKQQEKVEPQKIVKFSTSDLYKSISGDRLISEKIYFDGKKYNIQTSSWQSKYRAEAEVLKFRRKGYNAYVVEADLKTMGTWYRVKIFDFSTKADAESFIKKNNL